MPCFWKDWASVSISDAIVALAYSIIFAFPKARFFPSTVPSTPFPVTALKSSVFDSSTFCSLPYFTVASASGCSLELFREAINCKISLSRKGFPKTPIFSTVGLPSVMVPVLSTIRVSTLSIFSRASAFLISTPF